MNLYRKAAGSVDQDGKPAGGQFDTKPVPDPQTVKEDLLRKMAQTAGVNTPYPTKKRKMRLRTDSTMLRYNQFEQNHKCDGVVLDKDSRTGLWSAHTFYGDEDDGMINAMGIPWSGDTEEVSGYIAQVTASLANQGDVDPGNKDHLRCVAYGVASVGAALGLPNGWRPAPVYSKDGSEEAENQKYYLYPNNDGIILTYEEGKHNAERYHEHLRWSLQMTHSRFLREKPPFSNTNSDFRGDIAIKTNYSNFRCQETGKVNHSERLMIYSASFQKAMQLFAPRLQSDYAQTDYIEWLRNLSENDSPSGGDVMQSFSPDGRIAKAAYDAFGGLSPFPLGMESGHDGQAFWRYISNSDTDYTKHIFEPSGYMEIDWASYESKLKSIGFASIADFLDRPKDERTDNNCGVSEVETKPAFGDYRCRDFSLSNYVLGREPSVTYAPTKSINLADINSDMFATYRTQYLSTSRKTWHRNQVFTSATDYHSFMHHTETNRIPIALLCLAISHRTSEQRTKATAFLEANGYEPLVACFLDAALDSSEQERTKIEHLKQHENGHNTPPHIIKSRQDLHTHHAQLLRQTCQAWHEYELASEWYAKKGGRLDPSTLLRRAHQQST